MIPQQEFFVDENLGEIFRAGLRELGLIVRTHEDLGLSRGAKDADWILPVGLHGWPVFTLDSRIGRNNPTQLNLIRIGGLADFHISNNQPSPANHLHIVKKNISLIIVLAAFLPRPYRVSLTKTNANLLWWGKDLEAVFQQNTPLSFNHQPEQVE